MTSAPDHIGSKIAWDDTVLPFQLDRCDIRGRVARLDGVLDQILSQHHYPAPVEQLVAEAAGLGIPPEACEVPRRAAHARAA